MRLNHKVAIITGATGSIGGRIAAAFAREGARLILSGTRSAPATLPADATYVAGDITIEEHAAALVRAAVDRFGRVDILVNAHGLDFHSDLETTDFDAARRLSSLVELGAAVGVPWPTTEWGVGAR